jgi:hypothetical protein
MATATPPAAAEHKVVGDPDRPSGPLMGTIVPLALLLVYLGLAGFAVFLVIGVVYALQASTEKEMTFVLRRLGEGVPPISLTALLTHWSVISWASLTGILAVIGGALTLNRVSAKGWWTATGIVGGFGAVLVAARFLSPIVFPGQSTLFWFGSLGFTLVCGFIYIAWMYVRDSRSVGWAWATFLGVLRCSVYLILAGIFFQPALQTWEKSETFTKVLILFDISGSMGQSDHPPTDAVPNPVTRLDQVRDLMASQGGSFIQKILAKNPITLYQFGARLDEEFSELKRDAKPWTDTQWAAWLMMDPREWVLEGLSPEGRKAMMESEGWEADKPANADWANDWLAKGKIPETLKEDDKNKITQKRAKLPKRIEFRQQILGGTSYGEAARGIIEREANSSLAGIIIIGDGQSNQGSPAALEDVRRRAENMKVPVFTIGVGEAREQVRIQITELAAPDQAPPDEKFPIRVTVDGEGLAEQDVNVDLDFYLNVPANEIKVGETKPTHTIRRTGKFKAQSAGPIPVSTVEWLIDPDPKSEEMRPLGGIDSTTKKHELTPGDWVVVARVARDPKELFAGKQHFSEKTVIHVVKRPLRVLLFAGGPTRDYQFLRRLLVNEVDKKRAQMSICLQGTVSDPEGKRRVQDVDPERLLDHFPDKLADLKGGAADGDFYNLANYDVVVAFDPDWKVVKREWLDNLKRWVDTQGGGLILIAGPINTFDLASKGSETQFEPLLDLYPVRVENGILSAYDPSHRTNEPHRIEFIGANKETEFLKLKEDDENVTGGWDDFFFGDAKKETVDGKPIRGFYDYYPVSSVKATAKVLATFVDPGAKLSEELSTSYKGPPYMVTMKYASGRTMFVGSGEMWRLRLFREMYHERFWSKLLRYTAGGRLESKLTKRGDINMASKFTAGKLMQINVHLMTEEFKPVPDTTEVIAKITPPAGVTVGTDNTIRLAPNRQGDWAGLFDARLKLEIAGEYQISVPVPHSDARLTHTFTVKESNPELDDTRPNFALLWDLAGKVSELQCTDAQKDELKRKLETAIQRPDPDKKVPAESAARDQDRRLFFDLKTAPLIPDYLIERHDVQRNRGPIKDLWDEGPSVATGYNWVRKTLGLGLPELNKEADTRVGLALFAIVGLFSIEWLTRKLLKLA